MVAGAPRTISPNKETVIKLGEALVKWATEKTEDKEPLRSRFCEWYTLPDVGMIRKEWDALVKLDEFRLYYEQAQAALGRRIIDGTINPSIGHRFMWHYVPEAKEQEKEKIAFEAEMRAKEAIDVHKNACLMTNYPKTNPNDTTNTLQVPSEEISTSDTLGA